MNVLSGKKILLGITGSIAAYKSALIVRELVKKGALVKVVMTKDAAGFITPLTLSTLSKNPVLSELVDDKEQIWANHVEIGLWADLMIIAPASANTIAKFAHGLCDNLLTAVYLSARCPVMLAPAMDEDMWKHPSTQRNIASLQAFGNHIILVDSGELASGLVGPGRMAEPAAIVSATDSFFFSDPKPPSRLRQLSGKKALVTAGPTYEAIDPVRFIGNHSSGKMGVALADTLAEAGAHVTLILGPSSLQPGHSNVTIKHVTTAEEMYHAAHNAFPGSDITVMAAAVADYMPEAIAKQKIKKGAEERMTLSLVKTKDILQSLGAIKSNRQVLVGFALETNNEESHAMEKLHKKNLDLIVLNSLNHEGAGFQHDTNRISIMDRHDKIHSFPLKSKKEVARDIVDFILKVIEERKQEVKETAP